MGKIFRQGKLHSNSILCELLSRWPREDLLELRTWTVMNRFKHEYVAASSISPSYGCMQY